MELNLEELSKQIQELKEYVETRFKIIINETELIKQYRDPLDFRHKVDVVLDTNSKIMVILEEQDRRLNNAIGNTIQRKIPVDMLQNIYAFAKENMELTQKEICYHLGISQPLLSQYLNGKTGNNGDRYKIYEFIHNEIDKRNLKHANIRL